MIAVKTKPLSIAIDGPAGAGKSTVARRVADALGYLYIDTGAMYRAVAWAAVQAGVDAEDPAAVCALAARLRIELEPGRVWADGREITGEIRTPQISNLTSPISALACVRSHLAALQQDMARRGGVVMEGRDIGTVVLPDAAVKVFLVASLDERVRRRRADLDGQGIVRSREELEQEIAARDARDAGRDVAPMVPAPDAVALDSDGLNVEAVVERILALHQQAEARHDR